MPNWVRNNITIKGKKEDLDDLLAKVAVYPSEFSFEGIIPMPNDVDWYSWSIENWGTKWDADDVSVVRKSNTRALIYFDTAWSAPIPIYEAIKKMYPGLDVKVEYADEDLGYNCGTWHNGEHLIPDGQDLNFAAHVWGYTKRDLKEMYDL